MNEHKRVYDKIFPYTSQYTSVGLCPLTRIYIYIYRHICVCVCVCVCVCIGKLIDFQSRTKPQWKTRGLIERAKGINATLIEAVLADCDMLTQLCRKYNAPLINLVYLTEREKQSVRIPKRDHFVIPSRHF